jgi:hypothetical protein
MSLPTRSYTVQFEFAGNERGAPPQTTVVSLGGVSFPNNQGCTLMTPQRTRPVVVYRFGRRISEAT